MIGGNDITISTLIGGQAMDFAVRAARKLWRSAVIEDAETGNRIGAISTIKTGFPREILVYKDEIAARNWRELGADDSLVGTMIHLIVSAKSITLVIDSNASSEIREFVIALQRGLRQDIFRILATKRKAA
jgi:hypothetical protein